VNYQWAAATHRGRVRANNEDSYSPEASGRGPGPILVMVADGMGGAVGGEVASKTAVEHAVVGGGDPAERAERANQAVFEKTMSDPNLAGMGTTLTMVEFGADGIARMAHVGDSRAYIWHDGEIKQITDDHTLIAEHLAAGRITENDAASHPQRSVLTRVLGIGPDLEVDSMEVKVAPGDRFLICSDGLTNMVSDGQIADVLAAGTPEESVWTLVEQANRAGGHDNITVVVVDVEP
jgi:serine/threonine protein phosphatase PrpC